jgi:hypothetical protein
MTLYLNFRTLPVGGGVGGPKPWGGDGVAGPIALKLLSDASFAQRAIGKDVLFAVHGFNVNFENGVRSLGQLEAALNLEPSELFVGILWPGDFWLPVVNYPFEGATSIKCGDMLASYCNKQLTGARSLSFVSHSLGARLVLEAIEGLKQSARTVCLTAGAINDDCLTDEYAAATKNSTATSTLASREDLVLQLAFPVGDVIADILNTDHAFGQPALGRGGPAPAAGRTVSPSQIPDACDYDHGDYFPPAVTGVPEIGRWTKVAAFIAQAFRSQRQAWPPAC